ncbi:MAG TPA: IS21 family transposase [Candidatus Sulfotelmatobacter sp.]|nr:IS21 family transposase [Candidatus Sulfotelmatobacter sp.]
MISAEIRAQIRQWFFAEHWKIGTIAHALGLHPDTVRHAIESERFHRVQSLRACLTDPYLPFIRQTLDQHPRLRATRIYQMIRERGYQGSVIQLRRVIATLRPSRPEPFLRLHTFSGEQAQVDWAHFGEVRIGHARRRLSCFLITLSYSRALYLEFFFDQTLENFLRGHIRAFEAWSGVPRVILHDNLRSAVLERRGDQVHFHPRLLELSAHYHCMPRPCQVRAGNQKGRIERAIRYVRESFWAGRPFTTLPECNRQALLWRDQVAHQRPWPGDDTRTVGEAFAEEQSRLLPLPAHPFNTDLMIPVRSQKTIYIRFDLNDYSIPPEAVGRALTLVASDSVVRIFDGTQEIARHTRSYDRHQPVLDPRHQQALLQLKRKAFHSTPSGRLTQVVPEAETLLDVAFARGESAGSQTAQLLKLLELYGAVALRSAVREALERDTPRASSVAFLLRQQHQRASSSTPLVDLSRHPQAQSIDVRPHDLETYDELTRRDKSSDE